MIAALYARVSTQRQENEETIESQIMAIQDFAKKNGHTIIKEYRDDGWSGTLLARPALDELRIDAKQKTWEAVLMYDPDRLARKYSLQELVSDELSETGISLLYVTTPPPKDDSDRLLYGVKGLFAEYERSKIAERFRIGKLRKAREGNVVTSQAPYGYFYIPKTAKKEGHYKINKQEAEVVKMIFSWIGEDGMTIRGVIRKLQALGISPRKSVRGVWNTSTLGTLLRNETYIGTAHYYRSYAVVPEKPLKDVKYKRVKKTSRRNRPRTEWIEIKDVPKIIDKSLFEKVASQLKANFELCKRNKKNNYMLSGLIYCTCGYRRTGEGPQKGKHLYYRCSERVYCYPLPRKCYEKGVNARIADDLVWNKVSDFMTSPELIEEQMNAWANDKQSKKVTSTTSLDDLKRELEKIKKEEQRYIRIYGAELINFQQFEEAMKDLKVRRETLENQIKELSEQENQNDIIMPDSAIIQEFCDSASYALAKLEFERKQAILRKTVEKVIANQLWMEVTGYLTIGKEVEFCAERRDCRASKCWQEHAV